MADKATTPLTFNGTPISDADAREALAKIYGPQRVAEIIAGLANKTYGCASVAGGYLELAKTSVPSVPSVPEKPAK